MRTSATSGRLCCLSLAVTLVYWTSDDDLPVTTRTPAVTGNGTPSVGKGRVLFIPWTIANSHVAHHYRLADELVDDGFDVHVLRYNMVANDAHTPRPPARVKLIEFHSGADYAWVKPYYHRIRYRTPARDRLL